MSGRQWLRAPVDKIVNENERPHILGELNQTKPPPPITCPNGLVEMFLLFSLAWNLNSFQTALINW